MPELQPRQVQKELESGRIWPVYWLYGREAMKSRELLKRIRNAVRGSSGAEEDARTPAVFSLGEEILDGSEIDAGRVLEAAQSLSLGGGVRFLVIRDADQIKDPEALGELFGSPSTGGSAQELNWVCVFLAKDLDRRRKLTKQLLEKAAVVPCQEVAEAEREAWVSYLAKRRSLNLSPEVTTRLGALDPWSLDLIDRELEKFQISGTEDALLHAAELDSGGEAFLNAFFARDLKKSLSTLDSFVQSPDESLPLLGLLAWNARYLALYLDGGANSLKINRYLAEKLRRWASIWKLADALQLQSSLAQLDFELKQSPRLALGSWASLVHQFCRSSTDQ